MNKKILAILMALLLIVVGSIAMAETQTQLVIPKVYDTDSIVPVEELKIETKSVTYTAFNGTQEERSDIPQLTATLDTKTISDGEGSFIIDATNVNWPAAGKYDYTMQEVAGNIQGVEYDSTDVTFSVIVGYGEDEEGNPTYVVKDIQLTGDTDEGGKKLGSFKNVYTVTDPGENEDPDPSRPQAGELFITKTVAGNGANVEDEFTVKIIVSADTGKVLADGLSIKIGNADTQLDLEEDKETGTATFTIKHGDAVRVTGIPVGATVTVDETDLDATGYVSSYDENFDKSYVASMDKGATIALVNTRNMDINTGVNTDVLPYVVLMAIVAMGAVAFVMKKRIVRE